MRTFALFILILLSGGLVGAWSWSSSLAASQNPRPLFETPLPLTPTPDLELPVGYRYRFDGSDPVVLELYPPVSGLMDQNNQVLWAVQDWVVAHGADVRIAPCAITRDRGWYDCSWTLVYMPTPTSTPGPLITRQAGLVP